MSKNLLTILFIFYFIQTIVYRTHWFLMKLVFFLPHAVQFDKALLFLNAFDSRISVPNISLTTETIRFHCFFNFSSICFYSTAIFHCYILLFLHYFFISFIFFISLYSLDMLYTETKFWWLIHESIKTLELKLW